MKTHHPTTLAVFISVAALLFASTANADPVNDRKIEEAAEASYNFHTVLEGHVTVKAKDGVVTLTGTVQDKSEKNLAEDTVENLPSVVGVDNQIKVEPKYAEHSDGWVAFKIHTMLLVKANVSAINTTVAVNDGNVILSGTADNIAQKELTGAYVKDIDGVKSVQNNIVVKENPPAETTGEIIDDASITAQVKYALFTHESTSALKTKVTTTNGVVVVSGEAATDAEKSLVTELASDVRGVKSVTNNMTIKPANG